MLDFRPKDGAGLFISPDLRHVPPPSPPDSLTWMRRARHEGQIIKKCVRYWGSSACCAAPSLPPLPPHLLALFISLLLSPELPWRSQAAAAQSCPEYCFICERCFSFLSSESVLYACWTLAPSNAVYLFFPSRI